MKQFLAIFTGNSAAMFVNHPHFTLFPGDAVEIMECLPIPQAN